MHRNRFLALVVGLLVVGAAPVLDVVPAHAATPLVVTTTDDVVDAGDGLLSLREAVSQVTLQNGAAEIDLSPGAHYSLTRCATTIEHFNVTGDLDIAPTADPLLVSGQGSTIEQTCADERVLYNARVLTLRDLTLTGGDVREAPELEAVGGAVYTGAAITIEDSAFTDNHADHGGAIVSYSGGIDVVRSTFTANSADIGSGVMMVTGPFDATVEDSTVSGNTGGVTATIGVAGHLTARNSTITDNLATVSSLDTNVLRANQLLTIEHSTITDNDVEPTIGSIAFSYGSVELRGSVLVNGTVPECRASNAVTSLGGNVVRDTSCSPVSSDQTGVTDAGLSPLGDNGGPTATRRPDADSPVVDALPCTTVTVDQRGTTRPQGPGCDAGAVEVITQPDGLVRRTGGPYAGDGVHNTTGAGQTRTAVARRGTTARFQVRADNDGESGDTLVVRGPRGRGRVTARYLVGGIDVTSSVVAGRSIPLDPGSSSLVGVRIHVAPNAPTAWSATSCSASGRHQVSKTGSGQRSGSDDHAAR